MANQTEVARLHSKCVNCGNPIHLTGDTWYHTMSAMDRCDPDGSRATASPLASPPALDLEAMEAWTKDEHGENAFRVTAEDIEFARGTLSNFRGQCETMNEADLVLSLKYAFAVHDALLAEVRRLRERDLSRIDDIAVLQGEIESLKSQLGNIEEREAAVCPEDVPFDEHIRWLQAQLAEKEK